MVFLTVMFCVIVESNWKYNGLSELCLIGRILLLSHIIDVNDWQISTCSVFLIPGLYLGATYSGLFLSFSITRKSTSCIQDSGNQDVAEWISSCRI